MMLISVVIPAYNAEQYIVKCISSLLDQTYKKLEIVIVNDGSCDNTANICDDYAKTDVRIRVFHKENSGVSDARNVGLQNCTGDYICFLDADDWIEHDYFEDVVAVLRKNNYSILFNSWVIDTENRQSILRYEIADSFIMDQEAAVRELCMQRLFGWGVYATFYRRDIIEKISFDKNIRIGEDFYFKYHAIKKAENNMCYLPIHKYHYIRWQGSAMRSHNILKLSDDLIVLKRVMEAEGGVIADIIYDREYIPRVIEYAIIGILSDNPLEVELSNQFREEALHSFFKVLVSKRARRTTKCKIFFLVFPCKIRRYMCQLYLSWQKKYA